MGQVKGLGEFLSSEMLEVIDELRARVVSGEVHSLALMVEVQGQPYPLMLLCGLYDRDPHRAALAMQRASARVGRRVMRHDEEMGYVESS